MWRFGIDRLRKGFLQHLARDPIKVVVDPTKVGFYHLAQTIGVAFKKRTLPLVWSVRRGRRGHPKVEEQLVLFKKAANLMPENAEIWVVGDMEFQSVHLPGWGRLTDKHNDGWYWLLLHWETGEEGPWYLVSEQSGKIGKLTIYQHRMWIEEIWTI
jgi:hypothetical protein